jgi:CO/xanthine dehydrogenase FAD-binding subunit
MVTFNHISTGHGVKHEHIILYSTIIVHEFYCTLFAKGELITRVLIHPISRRKKTTRRWLSSGYSMATTLWFALVKPSQGQSREVGAWRSPGFPGRF